MDSLFANQNDSGSVFDGMSDPAPQPTAGPQGDAGLKRTAQMAAVVNTPPGGDLLAAIQQNTKGYQDLIQRAGDNTVRMDAAVKQQVAGLKSIPTAFDTTGLIDPEGPTKSALATQQILGEDLQKRQEYALEQQTVERIQNLAATGNSTQARVMLNNLEHGNPDDVVRDVNVKQLILRREVEKAQIAVDHQDWFSDALDFLSGWLPLKTSAGNIGNVPVHEGLKNWYDGLLSGQRVKAESDTLWNMNPADFAKFVREQLIPAVKDNATMFGLEGKTQELNILTRLQLPQPAWVENATNAVDNFGMLPFTKASKLALSVPSLLIRNGARTEAENLITRAALDATSEGVGAAAERTGVSGEELADRLLPKAAGGSTSNVVGISSDAGTGFARGRAILENAPEALRADRFKSNAEFQNAVDDLVERTSAEFKVDPIKDVEVSAEKLTTGQIIRRVKMTISNPARESGGFSSRKQAVGFATEAGYGTADVVRDESGQWFVKVTKDLPETGFYTELLKTKTTNAVSRLLLSGRAVADEWLNNLAVQSSGARAKQLTYLKGAVGKAFGGLGHGDREELGQLLARGISEARWYNPSEVSTLYRRAFNKEVSPKILDAYRATVDLNDAAYALRNDEKYASLALKGGKAITFPNHEALGVARANGFVFESKPVTRAFNLSDGVHYNPRKPLTDLEWGRLQEEGYKVVSLENPIKLQDGTRLKTFIAKGSDVRLDQLERIQLGYSEGLNRMYKGQWFAKQTVKGLQPDGEEFLLNPKTYIVGETQAEVKYWAERMEQARLAVKDGAGEGELDELFKGEAGFPTGKEFLSGLADGTYQGDTKFTHLFDREMPEEYAQGRFDKSMFDPEQAGYGDYLRTNGRMYYSGKGEHLPDFMGRKAPLLDPYKTINQALMNVSSLSSFSDFKLTSVERWLNTYEKYLDPHSFDPGASSMTKFKNAVVSPATQNRIRQAAIGEQQVINRNLGWRTEFDLEKQQVSRDFREWMIGDDPNSLKHDLMKDAFNWWENKNPVQAIRGMAFDAKLGLFNVGQFPLQIGTMVAALSIEPTEGLRGMMMLPALRGYLTKAGTENYLDFWAKQGLHGLGGFESEQEMKEFLRSAKKSGFFDVNAIHQLTNDHGPDAALSAFSSGIQNTREAGRFFFNEGEVWNRAVAFKIAWAETRKKFPGLSFEDSAAFNNHLLGRSEDYAFRMSTSSKAWWQSGLMSIPTQFWAYNARMLEMMVGDALTTPQKIRLFMGQGFLYGSAGLPMASFATEYLKGKNGEAPNLDSVWGAMDRGGLDYLMHKITGDNVMYGKRYGAGDWMASTIKDFLGFSQYGQKSPAEFLGGATAGIGGTFGQTSVDTFNLLHNLAGYSAAESGGGDVSWSMTKDSLVRLASNVSTVNNAVKAAMVFKYGQLVSQKGTVMARELPTTDGWGVMLGFQPGEIDNMNAITAYRKDRSDSVNKAAQQVVQYRQRWTNEPDNRDQLSKEVNLFVKMLPTDIRSDVLKKAHQTTPPSIYDNLKLQLQREKYRQQMIQSMEASSGSTE